MASDKRVILSSKRARGRRKRAALRSAATPEGPHKDVDAAATYAALDGEGLGHLEPEITILRDELASGQATAESEEDEDDEDEELVIVRRPSLEPGSAVRVAVPGFRETPEGFVVYAVTLGTDGIAVERRFSEFAALAAALGADRWPLPLPPKTWFRVTQAAALEERRARLECCLEAMLREPQAAELPVVRAFLTA